MDHAETLEFTIGWCVIHGARVVFKDKLVEVWYTFDNEIFVGVARTFVDAVDNASRLYGRLVALEVAGIK